MQDVQSGGDSPPRPKNSAKDARLRNAIDQPIQRYSERFEEIKSAPTTTRNIDHLIDTGDTPPIAQPVRPLSPLMLDELKSQLEKLLKKGFIQSSTSPWSSPVLFVKKADGSWRFCVDFRAVNEVTKRDRHPLPFIQECFESFGRSHPLYQGRPSIRLSPDADCGGPYS